MRPDATSPARRPRSGAPLPDDLRTALLAMVKQHGEPEVCTRVGVSRATFARALAGLGVNAGTVSLVRNAVEAKS